MSELKEVMNVMQVSGERIPSGYYKKCEVDAVLAEKDAEIAKLDDCIRDYSEKTKTLVITNLDMQRREDRHKYKRCLAMLEVAKLQRSKLTPRHSWWEVERARIKDERIKKLLKLVEKFKEAK